MWALARFLHRNKRMRQAAASAAIDQVKGRRTNYSFCRREKGRILQTIYVPLPVVDVHSNFASGKTARFISSPKRKMTAFRPRSLSELPITARLAQPPVARPRRCRTTTERNAIAAYPEALPQSCYRCPLKYNNPCASSAPHPNSPSARLYGKPPCAPTYSKRASDPRQVVPKLAVF